ncbi:hypothetical protein [Aquabacterium sp. OR-4]|uniref:hypothetical protein n=1 Tax=Aquabacterium sp. OR-4 TaxID=2978127 RepID=UPI0021B34B77|nr:hypothetical protein [Aquabacterium sp. OR-4]MDT7836268.1 hypothetical protein [Aquabacterium sp. OR-4]
MAVTKTEVVSVRVPPDVKAALVAAAGLERRSLASMVEFMVMDYCTRRGIAGAKSIGGTKGPRKTTQID